MTTVELVYRCEFHPSEDSIRALSYVREVYGIRRISYSTANGTIRVEYDATRLTTSAVARLVRGAGFAIAEEMSLIPPQPAPTAPPDPAAPSPATPAR